MREKSSPSNAPDGATDLANPLGRAENAVHDGQDQRTDDCARISTAKFHRCPQRASSKV